MPSSDKPTPPEILSFREKMRRRDALRKRTQGEYPDHEVIAALLRVVPFLGETLLDFWRSMRRRVEA